MSDIKNNKAQKIKDFFLIQKIRIENFIKEHKYISAFIGVFLFSCIVALIVYASDNDEYKGKVKISSASVTPKSTISTDKIESIPSFNTLVYDVSYKLSIDNLKDDATVVRSVVIKATLTNDIDAEWIINDEEDNYKPSENKKELTVTIYGSKVGEKLSKQLYLRVGNVENNSDINVTFDIYEETSDSLKYSIDNLKPVKVISKEATLTTKIVPGTAYKSEKIENGRLAPFGILVGLYKEQYPNGLSGLYFKPNFQVVLEATQTANQVTSQIELEEDKNFYGVYDSSTKLLSGMPNHKLDYFNFSVYNSGDSTNLEKTDKGVSGNLVTNTSPAAYLIGDKEINLEVDDTYREYGISTNESASALCKTDFKNCKRTITDKSGQEIKIDELTEKEGTYKVSYEYSSASGKITLYRTIKVTKKETKQMEESTYSLNDSKTITLLKGDLYKEPGLIKDGQILTNYESSITKDDEIKSSINTKEIGEYKITYIVTGTTKDNEENYNTITFERTVKIVDKMPFVKAQVLTANAIYTSSNGKYGDPLLSIDSKDFTCNSTSNCSVKYYDVLTNEEISKLNTNKAGTYNAVYKVTDKNGFVLEVTNKINFITKYMFTAKNIKSDGNLYLYNNNFIALGSYFVNAKSIRDSSVTNNITVDLIAYGNNNEEVSKGTSVNKNYSVGTKTNSLEFETKEKTLSYGEETVLKSLFSYSADGDSNIDEVTVKVPIAIGTSTSTNPTALFSMIEYSSNLKEAYQISGINDNQEVIVKYYACKMEESGTTCVGDAKEFESYDDENIQKENLTLAYLTYTVKEVKPGQNINFRIRLKTNVGNHGGTISLTSNAYYKETLEDKTIKDVNKESDPSAKINITAFKARTKVFVGSSEQDVIVNGAEKNSSTLSIYPTISLPGENVNTNLAGINELKSVIIKVNLPSGINYIYNENYMLPNVSNNGKTLTYELKGQKVNEWIDPIQFDINYDIDINSGTKKDISVEIQATTPDNISDTSDISERTTIRSIIYQNNEVISYNQYASNVAISKDTSFYVGTKLYNNDKMAHNNISLVTVLPYNDISNEKVSYTGTYTISDLPDNALCTVSLPALVSKEENLRDSTEIDWKNCDEYKKNNYSRVTAIKVNNINLDVNKLYDQRITINPKGNKTDDMYKINSYLVYDSDVKTLHELTVSVISKKITGTVWEDFDSDGIMKFDEKKVSGVTLKLYSSSDNELIKTVTTDEKGYYSLTDLMPGTYYVVAEYNTAKYGISPYQVNLDKSITSQFKSVTISNEKEDIKENEKEDVEKSDNDETKKEDEVNNQSVIVRTDDIEITDNTRQVSNINLGLALRKEYSVKLTKYITKAITTNRLGVSTTRDYGNATLAKLDVKDINNLSIKVVYTLELENTGYYPGYIYQVKDYIPDGMTFNDKYEENKGWVMNDNGYLENNTLFDQLINSGEKKYLTIAFDISRKEAGSFINYASVDDEDLQILVVAGQNEEGD